jgi:hypothetical protein
MRIRIRVQIPMHIQIRIQFQIQSFEIADLKKKFYQKIAIYLSLGLPTGRLSYRKSLHPQKRTSSN